MNSKEIKGNFVYVYGYVFEWEVRLCVLIMSEMMTQS